MRRDYWLWDGALSNVSTTTMSLNETRDTTIAVCDTEKEEIEAVREHYFGSSAVPYAEVVSSLCHEYAEDCDGLAVTDDGIELK